MKIDLLRLEAIGIGAAAPARRALQPQFGGNVEDECQVWMEIADRNPFEGLDEAQIHVSQDPLIDAGGIGEAVANDPFASGKRRRDGALDMIVAGGGEQHCLRLRPEWLCRP